MCNCGYSLLEVSSCGEASDVLLHPPLHGSLDLEKSWFALPGSVRQGKILFLN